MTDLSESKSLRYKAKHKIRFVTAASLFDGHDASINIMRRILQASSAEVIHLGHNRSVDEVVSAALQEDVQGIAVSSYQGGHIEYFKYMIDLLRQRGGDNTIGRAPQKVPDEGTADAEAQHHELLDAQVIHQTEMVIGVGIPRPVDLERAGGLAAVGVAQIRRDAAVLSIELLDRVEGAAAGQAGDRRVQSAAGDEQQREAGAGLLIVDANGAFFVEGAGGPSAPGLLRKHARRRRHHRRRGTRFQYFASDRIHHRVLLTFRLLALRISRGARDLEAPSAACEVKWRVYFSN